MPELARLCSACGQRMVRFANTLTRAPLFLWVCRRHDCTYAQIAPCHDRLGPLDPTADSSMQCLDCFGDLRKPKRSGA